MSVHTLQLTKSVAATTEDVQTVIIANGKSIEVLMFRANSAHENCTVKLLWDQGEAGEMIWELIAEGNTEMNISHKVVGDGVKKLAIALDNATAGSIFMSGFCEYEVED